MAFSSERAQIVQEELQKLVANGFINVTDYNRLTRAYQAYQRTAELDTGDMQKNPSPSDQTVEQNNYNPFDSLPPKKTARQKKPNLSKREKVQIKRPTTARKTPEQIRERNMTWLLVLGVSFLLISGLVVATSTWNQMGAMLKVVTLLGVSIFFLGLSAVSKKFLNIEKTAFAFLTLGSLLLPITFIAIGYFELFGNYLSLTGEGRYWLGIICTLVPLPLYVRNAYQTKARLFVWISFIFLSFSVGFFLAALHVPVDLFFLFIMVFNAGLLYLYHRFSKSNHQYLKLFFDELPAFSQLNLIISTLFMLFIFDQSIFYSFNLLITAFLYMAMVFVYQTKTKGYQFVFIALFAYGIYQLTENSILQTADSVIYALIGVSYLAFAYLMRKASLTSKIFHYASGIISGFAFIYISLQGTMIRADHSSWNILLAYVIIAGTYVYLAHITNKFIFRWLAPVFFFVIGIQFWRLVIDPYFADSFLITLFLYTIILFLGIGFKTRISYLKTIQKSTYYLSIGMLILTILGTFVSLRFVQMAVMLFIVGLIAIYLAIRSSDDTERRVAEWVHPISWLFAIYVLYEKIAEYYALYRVEFGLTSHIAIAGLILLAISLIWKKIGHKKFTRTAFYTGQISYIWAMVQLFNIYNSGDDVFIRPLILLIGIGLTYWLVQFSKKDALWGLVALTSSGFYYSLVTTFSIESISGFIWFMLGLPVLFLFIDRYLGKHMPALKPYFFYFAQSILALLVVLISLDRFFVFLFGSFHEAEIHPIVWFIPTLIYLYTTLTRTKEIEIKIALYAGLTMIVAATVSFLSHYQLMETTSFIYKWLVPIIPFIVIWFFVPDVWKRRMEWYLVPFMNFILWMATFAIVTSSGQLIVWLGLTVIILYFQHLRKWALYNVIPLIFSLVIIQSQLIFTDIFSNWLLFIIGFISLTYVGHVFFSSLLKMGNLKNTVIDWYSIIALIYLFNAFLFASDAIHIWFEVLTAFGLISWFLLQAKRLNQSILQKVFITLAGAFCLQPYYLVLNEYIDHLPELFHAELKALPLLVLAILLTHKTWHQHMKVMRHIQTILLVGITVYLIADAINGGTVGDALMTGTLSTVSLLAGIRYQLKSYFFVGVGTLLFNLIYQTRTYWGNMPWWVYLLFVGLLFITIASYHEWKKQRKEDGQLGAQLSKLIAQFKEWN